MPIAVTQLTYLQEFKDEDLDPSEEQNFGSATKTPHLIRGAERMVYWRNCTSVTLFREAQGSLTKVKEVRTTGKGVLPEKLALYFYGLGGEAKEA
jgi:hypothetical protein